MDSGASSGEQLERLAYHNVGQGVVGPTEAALVLAMRPAALERDLAWREFHRRHGVRLMGFIIQAMGADRRSDCEDIYQEAAIRIDKGLARYKHLREGGFHSWCVKIAQNLCLSAHRLKAGQPSPAELLSFEELEESISALGGEAGPDTPKTRTAREEDISWAFSKLNPVDQAVIHLRFVSPIPDAEIGRRIKKPADQIRKIRNKAIKKLKRFYQLAEAKRKRH